MNQSNSYTLDLNQISAVYFLGIGGIGMSAIARWFMQMGISVSGYDRTPSPLTDALQKEGAQICFEDRLEAIPTSISSNPSHTLVVITPAIPKEHQQWAFFREQGFQILKRSQVLGLISQSCFTVAVAGTHGKTTTSTMIAYLLREAGLGCTAFLGGISANYETNFWLSEKPLAETTLVVEADEFDRSFLTLFPNRAVLTSIDADHLDIYGEEEALHRSYADFVYQIKRDGQLWINEKIKLNYELRTGASAQSYGIDRGDWYASNIRPEGFGFSFQLNQGLINHGTFLLPMPGFHNVENAVAALCVAHGLGISFEKLRTFLAGFKGVKRRFEKIYDQGGRVLIDDYAHHPSEIQAALNSVRALYPNKKMGVVFQPHLFTRTRDFALEFSRSLNLADTLWMLDIYPARELPIPGVSSKMILDRADVVDRKLVTKEELPQLVAQSDCEIVVTLGAGDIDRLVQPLAEAMARQYKSVSA